MFEIDHIAERSAARFQEFREILASARQPDLPEVDKMFQSALDKLDAFSVTLSVVGQVKAGKSSLINALTGMGDFLPTEVNPWTAVITNLHYGHPDKPDTGGVFQLFSEAEWERMLKGDSETRKLAEELLPGFDTSVLEEQIVEMQESAKARLGALYHHLLGKEHRFNSVTPEVLEKYVSAGYGKNDSKSTVGRFSGITKSADVFMPAGPFRVPVTLSDTPGINDPFLVRDEITTSSFQKADVFIVAISAHQALNAADVALLKMLSVHSGKRTIIYVNRIDELDNPAQTLPKVLETLDARLQKEIEHPNYVLTSGSAFWGQTAVIGSDDDVAKALASEGFKSVAAAAEVDPTLSPREQLYHASGMKQLAQAITEVVDQGRISAALAEAVTEAGTAMALTGKVLKDRLKNESIGPVSSDDIGVIAAAERTNILQRVENLSHLTEELKKISADGQGLMVDNGDLVIHSVSFTIDTTINAFIQQQTDALRAAMANPKNAGGSWRMDTAQLRDKVEKQVAESYRVGRAKVDKLLVEYANRLNTTIAPVVGNVAVDRLLENLPHDEIFPGFKPQTSVVEIDLVANRGWQFWKSKNMSVDEAVDKIAHVIRSETFKAVEVVTETVSEAIAARNHEALERLRGVSESATGMLMGEVNTLHREASLLAGSGSREQVERIYEERKKRAEAIETKLSLLEATQLALYDGFQDIGVPEEWLNGSVDYPAEVAV